MGKKLLSSPYSIVENLKWPFLHAFPSMKKNYDFSPAPIKKTFFERSENSIRLVFFGDLMNMYGDIVPECCNELRELFISSDFTIGNLECPIMSDEKRKERLTSFRFKTSKEYVLEFCNKFSISPEKLCLTISNNHIGDFGESGVIRTTNTLNSLGIKVAGLKRDINPVSIKDHSIELVAGTEWMNHEYESSEYCVSRLSDMKHNERHHSFSVVLPHWGKEFRHFSNIEQRKLADKWIQSGAKLVVGHHSHVPMNGELLSNVPCFYGLGNFVSIQYTFPTKISLVLEVNIDFDREGRLNIADYKVHPFYFLDRQKVLPLHELDGKLYKRCMKRISKLFCMDTTE